MAECHLPTAQVLRNLLEYDPETGVLTWLPRTSEMFKDRPGFTAERSCAQWNNRYAGRRAGSIGSGGYVQVRLGAHMIPAHRIAWALTHGEWPEHEIDHIDHNSGNNRLSNLRHVTHRQNMRNLKRNVRNKTGVLGVMWSRRYGRWFAVISGDEGQKHLGTFKSKEAAIEARKAAEARFGFHANHGT